MIRVILLLFKTHSTAGHPVNYYYNGGMNGDHHALYRERIEGEREREHMAQCEN
jgi:hypothetical protein